MIKALTFVLLSSLFAQPSTEIPFVLYSVEISNNLGRGQGIYIACEIENAAIFSMFFMPDGGAQTLRFRHIKVGYVGWCDMGYGPLEYYTVNKFLMYDDLKWGVHTSWSLQRDGIYRWKHKKFGWFGEEKWIKQYEWGDGYWKESIPEYPMVPTPWGGKDYPFIPWGFDP